MKIAPVRRGRRTTVAVAVLAFLTFILLGAPAGMLGVAWPSIQESFTAPLEGLGLLLLVQRAGFLIASTASGRVADRVGHGPFLAAGALILGVGLLGYALAPTWAFLLGAGVVAGLGSGALDAGMNTYFAMNHSPRLMNWLHASFGIGATLGPAFLTGLLVAGFAWTVGYRSVGLAHLGLAVLLIVTLTLWRAGDAASGPGATAPDEVEEEPTLRPSTLGLLILLFVLSGGLEATGGQWSFSIFTASRGIEMAAAGRWVSIYWGSYTASRIVFGILANVTPALRALRANMGLAILAGLLFWWNPVNRVGFAGLALLGWALAPVFPLLVIATPTRLGRRRATHMIGYQLAATSIGIGLLPALAGLLAERLSLESIGGFISVAALGLFLVHEAIERRLPLLPQRRQ